MFMKQLSVYTLYLIRFQQIKVSFFSRHLVYGLYFWSQRAVCLCNLLSSQQTTHIFVCMHRHDKYYLEYHSSTRHFYRLLPLFFYTCDRDENFMLINLPACLEHFKTLSDFILDIYRRYIFERNANITYLCNFAFMYVLFARQKYTDFVKVFESLTCNAKKFSASERSYLSLIKF